METQQTVGNKRSYSELAALQSFKDRLEYLKLDGAVSEETFGSWRYLNQVFYRSKEWAELRKRIIVRDNGCDLGVPGRPIRGKILIHHMNPVSRDDILNRDPKMLNPDELICVSLDTHNLIHYGRSDNTEETIFSERYPGDTDLW